MTIRAEKGSFIWPFEKKGVTLHLYTNKLAMNHDIFQPAPQGSDGLQDAENSRVGAIADELRRLCQLCETQSGDSQSHVNHWEVEQRAAETFAKAHGLRLPIENVFDLGVPDPSGNENDTLLTIPWGTPQ